MAVAYNNIKVPTDGLVLYYDMHNPKSWKGEPTVNLAPNMGLNGVSGMTVTYVGLEDGWKKYSLSGTWSSGSYPYSMAITSHAFGAGVVHSSAVTIKTNVPGKFDNAFQIGLAYVNATQDPPGTTFTEDLGNGVHRIGKFGFAYVAATTQTGYIFSRPIADGTVFNPATDFVYIKDGQIEQKSYCTPYTPGERTTTTSLFDLTKKQTINMASLTYSSNNTFSFTNTSSNYIRITGDDINAGSWAYPEASFCIWVNPSSTAATSDNNVLTIENTFEIEFSNRNNGFSHVQYASNPWAWTGTIEDTLKNDEYNFLCYVHSLTDRKIYVNGVNTFTSTQTGGLASGTATYPYVTIGGRYSGTAANTRGSVPSVSIYSRVLQEPEIKKLFEMTRHRYGI